VAGSEWRAAAALVLATLCLAPPALAQDDWGDDDTLPVEIHGFAEAAGSGRVVADPTATNELVMTEARFRLDIAHYAARAELTFKGDFVADDITGVVTTDIRAALFKARMTGWLDLRAGRQVLTWGTGDLLFLNDLFPKDWVSFFIGRDDEFLKAPSNSLALAAYSKPINVDFVWTPVFTSDRYVTGERLSYFDPMVGGIVSAETMGQPLDAVPPAQTVENGEYAARLWRTIGGWELALYGYYGFTKQPRAFDPDSARATFAPLAVGGASVRANLAGGIANVEGAYYYSRDDKNGDDPFLPNSQARGLAGYEHEIVARVNLGLQYYFEWIQDHGALITGSPSPAYEPNEWRHLITGRLTWRLARDTWTLSLFGFVAPEDGDTYWRPVVGHQWSDAVNLTLGANVMTGDEDTFFGQFQNNSNLYLRLRYSF